MATTTPSKKAPARKTPAKPKAPAKPKIETFSVSRSALLTALSVVAPAVAGGVSTSSAVRDRISLKFSADTLVVTATDLDTTVVHDLDVTGTGDAVFSPQFSLFRSAIMSCSDDMTIGIEAAEARMFVKSSAFSVSIDELDEQLAFAGFEREYDRTFEFPAADVIPGMSKMASLASDDDARAVLTAVKFDQTPSGGLRVLVTDSYSAGEWSPPVRFDGDPVLIPASTLNLLGRSWTSLGKPDTLTLEFGPDAMRATLGRMVVTGRLVMGEFPAVENFTAPIGVPAATIAADDMAAASNRVHRLLENESHSSSAVGRPPVMFHWNDGGLTTSGHRSRVTDLDAVASYTGADLDAFALDGERAARALRCFAGEVVEVQSVDAVKPVHFSQGDLHVVLMPVRLPNK